MARDDLPWRPMGHDSVLESLRGQFNQLFDRFWSGQLEPLQLGRWAPAIDVSETDEAVLVRAEVPGLDPHKIEISLEGDVLTIRGEKQEEQHVDEENFHRVERQYGLFIRSIQLPTEVVADQVEAVSRQGVLEIRLPKSAAARPKKVKIKVEPDQPE